MTDIIERLRACPGVVWNTDPECNCAEAADEIERLRAHVAELSRVLNGITNRPDMAEKTLAALEHKP
jgi:hypothetical protein